MPSFAVPPGLHSLSHQTIYRAIFDMPPSWQRGTLVRLLRRSQSGRRRARRAKSERFTRISNITPRVLGHKTPNESYIDALRRFAPASSAS